MSNDIRMSYGEDLFIVFCIPEDFSPQVPLTVDVYIYKNVDNSSFEYVQDLFLLKELHYKDGHLNYSKQGCILEIPYFQLLKMYYDISLVLRYPDSLLSTI